MRMLQLEAKNTAVLAECWQKSQTRKSKNIKLVGRASIESNILAVLSYWEVGSLPGARHERKARDISELASTAGRD